MKNFMASIGQGALAVGRALKKVVHDLHSDFEGHWDWKQILAPPAFVYGFYYIGWTKPGDTMTFMAIEGVAMFLFGWAASPWGAGDPRLPRVPGAAQ